MLIMWSPAAGPGSRQPGPAASRVSLGQRMTAEAGVVEWWSGGVVQFIPVLTSHHAQGTVRERNSETTTETAQAQPGRLP